MKVGILGDIHANWEALTAVLEEMARQGVRQYVSVGDIVGYGANPNEVIDRLKEIGCTVVSGNHDQAICGQLSLEFFNSYARASCLWTQKQLSKEHIEYLRSLPLVREFEGFTVTHATLCYPENFEYIQTTYDAHLSFEHQKTPLTFIGHSHIPIVFYRRRKRILFDHAHEVRAENGQLALVNVGSVGQPRDGCPDAVCAVYDTDERLVRLTRIRYDVETAARKIRQAGLPEILAERLKYGR